MDSPNEQLPRYENTHRFGFTQFAQDAMREAHETQKPIMAVFNTFEFTVFADDTYEKVSQRYSLAISAERSKSLRERRRGEVGEKISSQTSKYREKYDSYYKFDEAPLKKKIHEIPPYVGERAQEVNELIGSFVSSIDKADPRHYAAYSDPQSAHEWYVSSFWPNAHWDDPGAAVIASEALSHLCDCGIITMEILERALEKIQVREQVAREFREAAEARRLASQPLSASESIPHTSRKNTWLQRLKKRFGL